MPTDFRSRIVLTAKSSAEKVFASTARASGKVTKALGGVAKAGVLAGAAIGTAFAVSAIRKAGQFEAAVKDLSAITGATGKDLEFLADKAKAFGAASTFGATAAAEAFKLVASAKPDLLANADALAATTQQVILLSEASGETLAASAQTVGQALNQFGADADQASRFVNVLAAGAKFGASEIAETAQALQKAGVAASGAGISFEETNAAVQVLAGVGIKGAEAGTALRGVFLKLQTQADNNLNPAIVGIDAALQNLADANLTAAEKVKLFGQENFVAGQSLIENRDKLKDLTGELTGTSVAIEQARIRQEGFEAQSKLLASAFETLQIELGEKLLPILTDVVKIVTDIINEFATQEDSIEQASVDFDDLDATLRTLVGTFSVIKTAIQVVGKIIGAQAAVLVKLFSGEFAAIPDIIGNAFEDVSTTVTDGFEQAARITSTRTPKIIEDALSKPIILESAKTAGTKIAKSLFDGVALITDEAASEASAAQLQALSDRIENIRAGTLSETEAEIERFETLRGVLFQGRLAFSEDKALFDQIETDALLQHETRLTDIANKGVKDRNKFEELATKDKVNFVLGMLESQTAGVATQSKAMFRINQAAALGSAVVNTAEAITNALKVSPFPVGLALAAVAAAAGAAQIATIASAKPGGGTTPSVSASTPTFGGQPVAAPQSVGGPGGGFGGRTEPGQRIDINIDGLPTSGMMQATVVRELMESINDQLGDGVTLDVDGGSGGGNAGTQRGSS